MGIEICESCGNTELSDDMVLLNGRRICHRCVAPGIRPSQLLKYHNLALITLRKHLAECEENIPVTNSTVVQNKTEPKTEDPLVKSALARHQSQETPTSRKKKVEDKVYKTLAEGERATYLKNQARK